MPRTSTPKTTADLLRELEPVVAAELDRHLSTAKEWFPHQYVPWSRGRDFDGPLDGEPWSPEDSSVSPAAREALIVKPHAPSRPRNRPEESVASSDGRPRTRSRHRR